MKINGSEIFEKFADTAAGKADAAQRIRDGIDPYPPSPSQLDAEATAEFLEKAAPQSGGGWIACCPVPDHAIADRARPSREKPTGRPTAWVMFRRSRRRVLGANRITATAWSPGRLPKTQRQLGQVAPALVRPPSIADLRRCAFPLRAAPRA